MYIYKKAILAANHARCPLSVGLPRVSGIYIYIKWLSSGDYICSQMNALSMLLTMTPTWNLNFTVVEYLFQSRELLVIAGSHLSFF
jgi:hypothetical protein